MVYGFILRLWSHSKLHGKVLLEDQGLENARLTDADRQFLQSR